jgi:hypothetical protein
LRFLPQGFFFHLKFGNTVHRTAVFFGDLKIVFSFFIKEKFEYLPIVLPTSFRPNKPQQGKAEDQIHRGKGIYTVLVYIHIPQ